MKKDQSVYDKNLVCLKRRDKDLYERIVNGETGERKVYVQAARSTDPTLFMQTEGDGFIPVHSTYDPKKEAKRWVRTKKIEENTVYVFFGLGLGYSVEAFYKKVSRGRIKTRLFILEKNINVFRKLLETRDIRYLLKSDSVLFSIADTKMAVITKIRILLTGISDPSIDIKELYPEVFLDSMYYNEMQREMRDEYRWAITNTGTIIVYSPMWQYNTLQNLPAIISNPGVDALFGKFSGHAAFMVAPGPSLIKSLELLQTLQNRALMVCCGTALNALFKHGIEPHLTTIVDGTKETLDQFKNAGERSVYLAANASSFPSSVYTFKDRLFTFSCQNPILSWLENFCEKPYGMLTAGGTVAVSAVDMAIRAGCNPVILVGLDMAVADDGREYSLDTHKEHCHVETMDGMVCVKGNYQEKVYTHQGFHLYRRAVETLIRAYPNVRFINATAGGAYIEGTEVMPLEEAQSLLPEGPVDYLGLIRDIHKQHMENYPVDYKVLYDNITEVSENFHEIERMAGEAAMMCNKVIFLCVSGRRESEKELKGIFTKLDEIDKHLISLEHNSKLMDMTLRPMVYGIMARFTEEEKKLPSAVAANKRSRKLYENIAGASIWTRLMIEGFQKNLENKDLYPKNTA